MKKVKNEERALKQKTVREEQWQRDRNTKRQGDGETYVETEIQRHLQRKTKSQRHRETMRHRYKSRHKYRKS